MRGDLGTWGLGGFGGFGEARELIISLSPYFPISLFTTVNFAHPSHYQEICLQSNLRATTI